MLRGMADRCVRWGLLGGLLWVASGCGPQVPEPATDAGSISGTPGTTTGGSSPSGAMDPTTAPTTGSTGVLSTGAGTGPTTTGTGATSTTGGAAWCDLAEQDCPDEEKCVAYDSPENGDPYWDATRCVPVPPTPAKKGEPCAVEGGESVFSGLDNCEKGTMCLFFDWETGQDGICTALCGPNDTCADGEICLGKTSDSALSLCFQTCDPLVQDCPPEQGCYGDPSLDAFFCGRFDPLEEPGLDGSPCAYTNACAPGFSCVESDRLEGCMDDYCCTAFCTVGDDSLCAPGEACVPFFDPETPPQGHEDVGVCAIPE